MGFLDRLAHAWNAFRQLDEPSTRAPVYRNLGYSSTRRLDRMYFSKGNERSIVTAIYNRIATDVCDIDIRHVKVDENGRYLSDVNSDLNKCLTLEANKDQTARAFMQDVVQSMFDEGCVSIVPIDTDINPEEGSFDILSVRTGKITQWYPDHVRVEVYNDRLGYRQEIVMEKSKVCIIENPFYAIMNSPNSTLQRLIRKLNILDAIDEQSGSGKLDLIIQLPYIVKTDVRREQAEKRRRDIEDQLGNSKYGIAYTDGTEKITQLNRPVDNNLLSQITYLTSMLYSQLGITEEILNGTADEKTMINYQNRIVKPIVTAITDEINRKFLTKAARTQHKMIKYFLDPFKLVSMTNMAEIADKFTRNTILTPNEIRQIIGYKPADDAKADELRNPNISSSEDAQNAPEQQQMSIADTPVSSLMNGGNNQNG